MARADYGLGWLILFALCIFLVLLWAGKRWTIPYWKPFEWEFPLHITLLIGFWLRLPHLLDSLWYDEMFTAAVVKVPFENLPQVIMADVHPPLNYLIQWLTARLFGMSEVALRLPSMVFGLLLIYLVYRLALALGLERKTALWSALIVALLPSSIYYSHEARAYSLMACLAVGGTISLLEGKKLPFILCAGLLPFTHNLGYAYLGVLGLVAVVYQRWVLPPILAGLIGALWFPFMLQQSQEIVNGFWIPPQTLAGVFWYIPDMTLSIRIEPGAVLVTYVPMLVFTLFSLYAARRWLSPSKSLVYFSLVFAPPLGIGLISAVWYPVYINRAFLASGLVLVIAWAYLMNQHRFYQLVTLGFIVIALGSYLLHGERKDMRSAMDVCRGTDAAYYMGLPAQFMGDYYLGLPSLLWSGANDLNQTLTPGAKAAFGFEQGKLSQLKGEICFVQVVTPYTTIVEWVTTQNILEDYPHQTYAFEYGNSFQLYLHRLTL